ncbi:hypothetical protein HN51_022371 [Arachis hypogaea]
MPTFGNTKYWIFLFYLRVAPACFPVPFVGFARNKLKQSWSKLNLESREILHAASYHDMLASSQEFQDLVNAYKATAGFDWLMDATSSQKNSNSTVKIRKIYVEKQFDASKGDQLIKEKEKKKGNQGFQPYLQYLNKNKGYVHTKRKNRLKAKIINDVVFVIINSRLVKKKQIRKILDYDYSFDELDSDDEWIIADEDGKKEDLDALIPDPDLNDRANGNKVVGASKDHLAIPYFDDDEFEELLQVPPPFTPNN